MYRNKLLLFKCFGDGPPDPSTGKIKLIKLRGKTHMEKVGHEDMKTTMKIYTHVTKKMKEDASAKVKYLYGDALSQINIK
ncbi:hypothetical protein [Oceanobacillus senegalensis]|uniref:hypothetical protein n=1 Tax=Oceanobacillus senegalensis TaxID=1936063 RepID=UPI000A3143EE